MREAIRAAIEALDGLIWYVGQLETLVYSDDDKGEHEQVTAAESALSLLRAAVGEGEEPSRYRWDTDLDLMVGPVPYGEWVKWADVACPIAADVQRDAERYRWLRACGPDWHNLNILDSLGNLEAEALDAAIDVAMKEGK